ncbi:hypothetical protein BN1044_02743, partial [Hafnia alvei]
TRLGLARAIDGGGDVHRFGFQVGKRHGGLAVAVGFG